MKFHKMYYVTKYEMALRLTRDGLKMDSDGLRLGSIGQCGLEMASRWT